MEKDGTSTSETPTKTDPKSTNSTPVKETPLKKKPNGESYEVVVVGAGFAGCMVCKKLQKTKNINLTLIDPKGYFEFTPAVLRVLCIPEKAEYISVPIQHILPKGKTIVGEVVDCDEKSVKLADGQIIPYDVLVISSGSRYNSTSVQKASTADAQNMKLEEMFNEIRKDPIEYKHFKEFCNRNWATETISYFETLDLFSESYGKYKKASDEKKSDDLLKNLTDQFELHLGYIVEKFLREGSDMEINITGQSRKNLLKLVSEKKYDELIPALEKERLLMLRSIRDRLVDFTSGANIKAKYTSSDYRSEALKLEAEKLSKADSVIIIGGGPVGVELAGEIVKKYPKKNVTLITRSEGLMPRFPKSAQKEVQKALEKKKVSVRLKESVVSIRNVKGQASVATDKDQVLTAETVYVCCGTTVNSEFMQNNFSDCLDGPSGHVKVDRTLQVTNHPNMFALGDSNNVQEEKTAERAMAHAQLAADNILKLLKGQRLKTHSTQARPMMMPIALGWGSGISFGSSGMVLGRGWVTTKTKDFIEGYVLGMYGKDKDVLKNEDYNSIVYAPDTEKEKKIQKWNSRRNLKASQLSPNNSSSSSSTKTTTTSDAVSPSKDDKELYSDKSPEPTPQKEKPSTDKDEVEEGDGKRKDDDDTDDKDKPTEVKDDTSTTTTTPKDNEVTKEDNDQSEKTITTTTNTDTTTTNDASKKDNNEDGSNTDDDDDDKSNTPEERSESKSHSKQTEESHEEAKEGSSHKSTNDHSNGNDDTESNSETQSDVEDDINNKENVSGDGKSGSSITNDASSNNGEGESTDGDDNKSDGSSEEKSEEKSNEDRSNDNDDSDGTEDEGSDE
eukprot:TRINITY_DN7162_c0_g1_i2.p1 TRINITY_DN7162_c0_g1~~TRINITY_DN7162_c0_g1_i2.p1  ORF type:complete len:844 (+),score=274.21 TRINITY_DN7162_c0_g1_i2:12-2543(+)